MKTLKHIPAALALLAMAGCQNEEIQPLDFQTDPSAVHISASVGRMGTRSNPHDDALPGFNAGDRISVSTADQPAVVYTFDGNTTWTPEEGKYLTWLNTSDVNTGQNFTAYYPSTYTDDGNLPIETDQSILGNLQKSDIMSFYGSCTKGQNNTVSLTLQRKTARIVISKDFDWQGQYLDGENPTHRVQSIQIHIKEGDITTTITPYKVENGHYYALVPPTYNSNASVFLTLTVVPNEGGGETQYTINGIYALIPGYSNTYTLTIGKDVAEVGNVTVAKWATGSILGEGSEGKAEEMTYTVSTSDDGKNTYVVYNVKGLQEVNQLVQNDLSANITLAADITLPTPADGGSNWTPIGSNQEAYNGTFDGAGHTIRGLVINSSSVDQGLIGFLQNGTVKNVTIEGCTITGSSQIGGIVGNNQMGNIEGCTVKSTDSYSVVINGSGGNVGGIVGMNSSGSVIGCQVLADGGSCEVTDKSVPGDVGGIAGSSYGGTLTACFAEGVNVTSQDTDFGGIVGYSTYYLIGCYAYRCTSGSESLTGDVNIVGDNRSTVSDCYYTTSTGTFGACGGTAATNWEQALAAMNAAISSSGWQWSGTQDAPTLTKGTSDNAQE